MSGADQIPAEDLRRPEIDLSAYLPLFEDEDISEADKLMLLEVLWSLVISFAQLGWGVHPVQQARATRQNSQPDCGKVENKFEPDAEESAPVLELPSRILNRRFSATANEAAHE